MIQIERHLLEILTIILLLNSFVYVLVTEELEYQRDPVGVEKQLCKVFELEYVFGSLSVLPSLTQE